MKKKRYKFISKKRIHFCTSDIFFSSLSQRIKKNTLSYTHMVFFFTKERQEITFYLILFTSKCCVFICYDYLQASRKHYMKHIGKIAINIITIFHEWVNAKINVNTKIKYYFLSAFFDCLLVQYDVIFFTSLHSLFFVYFVYSHSLSVVIFYAFIPFISV